jgi:hypothetical protein
MNTLLLDTVTWDLCADASGNIAMATEPYALAQDVASAIKTFLGDCYYDTTDGINYFLTILGKRPTLQVFQALMVAAALTVPDVVTAECIITAFEGPSRTVTGQVLFIDVNGEAGNVSF